MRNKNSECDCQEWDQAIAFICRRLGTGPQSLKMLEETFRVEDDCAPSHVNKKVVWWKNVVSAKVQSIPRFSTLLDF
jgi:hypothetical protein